MKQILTVAICLMFSVVSSADAQEPKPAPAPPVGELKTVEQKASYAIGFSQGQNLKSQNLGLDIKLFLRGFTDGIDGKEGLLSEQEIEQVFVEFRRILQKRAAEVGKKNLEVGKKFLAENGKKPGITTTDSGLQYKVLKKGNGSKPKKADNVTTHYKGSLIDGTVFDGSYKGKVPTEKDMPISFDVGGVIPGWTEALLLMKVGDRWRLFIPSEIAYGAQKRGKHITPNSVLIFEIELVSIN